MTVFFRSLMWVTLGGLGCYLLLELVLFLLPTPQGLGRHESARFTPMEAGIPGHRFVSGAGWNLRLFNEGRLNSDGFHAEADFPENGTEGIVAVIGDSFIEATMIPYGQTLHGVMRQERGDRVIGLGVSGGELGNHEFLAHRASELWGVSALVIVINEEDLYQSLASKKNRAFYSLDKQREVSLNLPKVTQTSQTTQLLKKSNVLRYVVGALKLWPQRFKKTVMKTEFGRFQVTSSPTAKNGVPQESELEATFTHFLERLRQIQEKEQLDVRFIVYGALKSPFHYQNYRELHPLTQVFERMVGAGEYDMEVINAAELFLNQFEGHTRPRWMNDGHWTPIAHEVIAKEVIHSLNRNRGK